MKIAKLSELRGRLQLQSGLLITKAKEIDAFIEASPDELKTLRAYCDGLAQSIEKFQNDIEDVRADIREQIQFKKEVGVFELDDLDDDFLPDYVTEIKSEIEKMSEDASKLAQQYEYLTVRASMVPADHAIRFLGQRNPSPVIGQSLSDITAQNGICVSNK